MSKRGAAVVAAILLLQFGPGLGAKTFALKNPWCRRQLHVTRHYDIALQPGRPTVAVIPALRSFMGGTNWQVIKSSSFKFSEAPDSYKLVSDDYGMPRHSYQLTWNAPKSDQVSVDQALDVDLTWYSNLYTQAKLPYSAATLARYKASLGADTEEGVDPNNAGVAATAALIGRGADAEATVERVCDWINDNIQYASGERSMAETLAQKAGSCTPMSQLACSLLRRLGIPAEPVDALFTHSGGGHTFIEVYFPDAGWIFYDLSNWNRGFKSLDCLVAAGWAYRSGAPGGNQAWTEGAFCEQEDRAPFDEAGEDPASELRFSPSRVDVKGVTVLRPAPPPGVKIRRRSIKEIILDPKSDVAL